MMNKLIALGNKRRAACITPCINCFLSVPVFLMAASVLISTGSWFFKGVRICTRWLLMFEVWGRGLLWLLIPPCDTAVQLAAPRSSQQSLGYFATPVHEMIVAHEDIERTQEEVDEKCHHAEHVFKRVVMSTISETLIAINNIFLTAAQYQHIIVNYCVIYLHTKKNYGPFPF